jgi:DNA polymerase-3 subunit gamma/tau
MAEEDSEQVFTRMKEVLDRGVPVEQFVVDLAEYFRNMLFIKHGIERESILGYPVSHFSQKAREAFTTRQIEYAVELLLELYRSLRFSLNQRFELELALSKLSSLSAKLSGEELIYEVENLRQELIQNAPAGSASQHGSADSAGSTTSSGAAAASEPATGPGGEAKKKASEPSGQQLNTASAPAEDTSPTAHHPDRQPPAAPISHDAGSDSAAPKAAPVRPEALGTPAPQESGPVRTAAEDEEERELGSDEIKGIREELRRRPTLASALAKVKHWSLSASTLLLRCEHSYPARKIREELSALQEVASSQLERRVEIQVRLIDNENNHSQGSGSADEQIELVKKVFRGRIVHGANNESDGSL